MTRSEALDLALTAAAEAGKMILRVYADGFDVSYKYADDPVTRADQEANAYLCDRLERAFPGIPIVAEESDPSTFTAYRSAPEAFFVDPLDGTREFVARNGQFCVMIGLAEQGRATMGVILCPELGQTYGGAEGLGAFRLEPDGARTPIHVTDTRGREAADVLVSRFHAPASIEAFRTLFGVAQVRPVGSSGVKAAFLASGQADAYVQAGPAGSLWDGCAADALVHAAGGKFTNARGERLDYRTPVLRMETGVLATNAWLHDALLERLVAQRAIPEG